jgi:uncharacterized lipoprotein YddW (UPF0748 family)
VKNCSYKNVWLFGLMLMWLSIGPVWQTAAAQEQGYVEEVRGVWITNVASQVLYDKDRIAEAMDYLAANGFNVVFPVVWNKAETQYPSQVMTDEFNWPMENTFVRQGRDPLAELITEAHRNGMEVIPWFEYGFAASFGGIQGNRILDKYPHWAARDVNGNVAQRNNFFWLNGIHPEVQDFMMRLIHEVIDNYDIDGIQGDDRLPAMPSNAGYDQYTVELYKSEHNGAAPPNFDMLSEWLVWRGDKLTNFLGRLYRSVKEKDENLIVSMSPSQYRWGWDNYLQDTPRWLDSNYVDMVHPQLYRPTAPQYRTELNVAIGNFCSEVAGGRFCNDDPNELVGGYIRSRDLHKFSPGIITRAGNVVYGPEIIRQKLNLNRQYGVQGEVFFFYEGMGAFNNYLADSLRVSHYSNPAILPFRQGQLRRPPATILNETDAGVERLGSWQAVVPFPAPSGYQGRSLRSNAASNSTITWNIDVPHDAWYRVYTYIPFDNNSAGVATTGAPYTVFYNDGADSVLTRINQRESRNRGWVRIANVYLEKGVQPVVRLRTVDIEDGSPVFVDAVMLILDRSKSPDVLISVPTSIDHQPEEDLPTATELLPAFPNPFNPTTTIQYRLDGAGHVRLSVYDVLGRRVALLADQGMPEGLHQVTFDGTGLSSGVYLYRLQAGQQILTQKMMLIK